MSSCVYYIEAKLDGTNWTDLTPDVLNDYINFKYGIYGNGPIDRIGDIGEMTFSLNNNELNSAGLTGYYTPGHPNARVGFVIGLKVRLRLVYDGKEKVKFYGSIPPDGIEIQTGSLTERLVNVTVKDWMHQAASHELVSPAFTTNKTINQVVALIIANMSIAPLAVDYRTPEETFGTVFDTVKSTTRAMSELSKVAMSELGYVYITRNTGAEVLRVEGRYTRTNETNEVTGISLDTESSRPLTTEADERILTEDGLYYLVIDEVESAVFDNVQVDMSALYGNQLYNRVKVTSYPRIIDTASTTVLFSLSYPILLAGGETTTFTGRYRDPTGTYDNVAGTDMQAPVSGTDYKLTANADGTGTVLTANLTVTPVYGTADVVYTLTNTGATNGYVFILRALGKGIYTPDPVDYVLEDATSISAVGPSQLDFDMKYQDDPTVNSGIANVILSQTKEAKIIPQWVLFCANTSSFFMNSFIGFEPGDRVNIKEAVTGMDDDYYIQGVEANIQNGIIFFKWHIRNAGFDTYTYGVWDTDNWDDSTSPWAF